MSPDMEGIADYLFIYILIYLILELFYDSIRLSFAEEPPTLRKRCSCNLYNIYNIITCCLLAERDFGLCRASVVDL